MWLLLIDGIGSKLPVPSHRMPPVHSRSGFRRRRREVPGESARPSMRLLRANTTRRPSPTGARAPIVFSTRRARRGVEPGHAAWGAKRRPGTPRGRERPGPALARGADGTGGVGSRGWHRMLHGRAIPPAAFAFASKHPTDFLELSQKAFSASYYLQQNNRRQHFLTTFSTHPNSRSCFDLCCKFAVHVSQAKLLGRYCGDHT